MRSALHPHQLLALAGLREALFAGHRRPVIQAPTGAGKTMLAAAITDGALAKGRRVLFVVPFLSLVDQTVAAFVAEGITAVGVMQGQHPMTDATQPVQVASLQTLRRRRIPAADIVIIDEAHRWFDFIGTWMGMPEWKDVPFVGLSATPWTRGLGKHYDHLIVAATTTELIDKGLLSPFRAYAPAHPDLSGVSVMAGDFHEGELAEVMSEPVLVADTVTTWLRLGEDRPTLCFAVDRAHARKLADEFEAAGVPTGYVDANTPSDERERVGRRLREGQIKVVCNVYCLSTGVDWDIRCIILARPTRSEILYTQIVGRGLRIADGKDDCLILDHSDTTLRLGFVTDIHHETLDAGRPRTATTAGKARPTPLPTECPSCSFLKPAGVRKCPGCGFVPERQSAVEARDGELVQLTGARKAKGDISGHTRQQVYSMLISVQKDRGYKAGYAAARFKARYDTWPRGLGEVPAAPDAAFLNWLKSQEIAFHKRRQKEASRAA